MVQAQFHHIDMQRLRDKGADKSTVAVALTSGVPKVEEGVLDGFVNMLTYIWGGMDLSCGSACEVNCMDIWTGDDTATNS